MRRIRHKISDVFGVCCQASTKLLTFIVMHALYIYCQRWSTLRSLYFHFCSQTPPFGSLWSSVCEASPLTKRLKFYRFLKGALSLSLKDETTTLLLHAYGISSVTDDGIEVFGLWPEFLVALL